MANSKEEKVSRLHEILDRVISKFSSNEEVEVSLEEATMPDGTVISFESKEVGTPVMVIPAEGEPSPAPDGEYPISETEVLVVAEGVIAEVKEPEAAPEEEAVVEEAAETTEVKGTSDIFNLEILKTKIDFSKEGFHTITFSISNGVIEWGNLYSESFQELSEQKSELEVKLGDKDKEIADLKTKFEEDLKLLGETIKTSGLVQAPVEKETKTVLSKSDLIAWQLEEQRKSKKVY